VAERALSTERVRVPKTAELVAAQLRRQIVRGELKEGDALPPEAALMEEFGVSRPTLREAFRVLEAESLISIRRGSRGGARVHTPSGEVAARYTGLLLQYRGTTVGDVYQVRTILEPPAAGLVAARRAPEALGTLREALADEERSLDDSITFAHASARFHEHVLEQAGNQTLAVIAGMLADIIDLHQEAVVAEGASRPTHTEETRQAHRAHARLVELVEAGDTAGAEKHWAEHMQAIGEFLLKGAGAKTVVELFG
jgi:DNA-binding FadR family transcriptional regulator